MIYQYTRHYLRKTFVKPRIDFIWSLQDNLKFFNYIEKRYTIDEFTKEALEAKEAFKDFFEPVGNIIFRYKEESGIKIKIFPYRVNPKDSKHLKTISSIILNNRKSIKYPYQDQNDQIAILGKIRREINREVEGSDESVNIRELIKHAIRIALDLSDRDIVVQLKRKYIVKIFQKNSVIKAEVQKPREGVQNRFNGYTAEQIEETYKEIFVSGSANIKAFLRDVTKRVFRADLDFRIISNKYYEFNVLRIIHAYITKELKGYISLEEDYILGIAGFLMRKHFEEIHELMANRLIECVYEKNENANNFLLYYNGKIVLKDNKKYKIPSLETEDGKQWNNSSLIGICNLWMNTKKKKEKFEHKMMDADAKIDELNSTLLYIEPEKKEQEKIIAETEKKAEKINKNHAQLEAKLKYLENASLNSNDYFSLSEEVKVSSEEVAVFQTIIQEARANIQLIKNTNMTTYTELEYFTSKKKQLLLDIKAQNSNINAKNTQMDPIIKSIVKVLMARTKLVS